MASRISPRTKRPVTARPKPKASERKTTLLDQEATLDQRDADQDEHMVDIAEEDASADLDETEDDEPSQAVAPAANREVGAVSATPLVRRPWTDSLPRWLPKYLREALIELTKVTYPSRQEAFNLTLLVIGVAVFFAVVFGLIDLGLFSALRAFTDKVLAK